MSSVKKISWSDDEKALVFARCLKIRADKPLLPVLAVMRQAQEILPENRRRSIKSTHQAQLALGLEYMGKLEAAGKPKMVETASTEELFSELNARTDLSTLIGLIVEQVLDGLESRLDVSVSLADSEPHGSGDVAKHDPFGFRVK
jgi:hypothetical protein